MLPIVFGVQIESDVLMWVIGIIASIILTLIGLIWTIYNTSINKRFDDMKEENNKVLLKTDEDSKKCDNKFEQLFKRLDQETKEREDKSEHLRTLVFMDIDKNKERMNDIEVTVAEFSGTYITRKEFDDKRGYK